MSKVGRFETGAIGGITALSVSPDQADQDALKSIFGRSDWSHWTGFNWALKTSQGLDEALPILRNDRVPVVLCERDLRQRTWKDMMEAVALLPDPPYLIVTSKLADERLWVEALNLGAYDVLQTPFNAAEVTRTLGLAWLRWTDRHRNTLARAARSVA